MIGCSKRFVFWITHHLVLKPGQEGLACWNSYFAPPAHQITSKHPLLEDPKMPNLGPARQSQRAQCAFALARRIFSFFVCVPVCLLLLVLGSPITKACLSTRQSIPFKCICSKQVMVPLSIFKYCAAPGWEVVAATTPGLGRIFLISIYI